MSNARYIWTDDYIATIERTDPGIYSVVLDPRDNSLAALRTRIRAEVVKNEAGFAGRQWELVETGRPVTQHPSIKDAVLTLIDEARSRRAIALFVARGTES